MINRIVSSLYSLALLTLVLVRNAHQVLCNHNDILERAIHVTQIDRLHLPPNTVGPVGTAFDPTGAGPYVSVNNGRVLKWAGPYIGFADFAVTSHNWSRQVCESNDTNLEPVCGRPVFIDFYNKEGTLYITDAYKNLRSVEFHGGVATLLASSAEGLPFTLTCALDVDQETGDVYFSDNNFNFQLKDLEEAIHKRDASGRLMKYDHVTKKVTVLLRNLGLPAGITVSKDGRFVLVSEYAKARILRYWIKGRNANTSEIFFSLPSMPLAGPINITKKTNGDFWVAVLNGTLTDAIPYGILLDKNGKVLRALNFATANINVVVTNVQERNGKLYIGSLGLDFVGVTRTTRG